jgi:hypothetical protein
MFHKIEKGVKKLKARAIMVERRHCFLGRASRFVAA